MAMVFHLRFRLHLHPRITFNCFLHSRSFAGVSRKKHHEKLRDLELLYIRGEHLPRDCIYNLLSKSHGKRDLDLVYYERLQLILISCGLHKHAALGDHLVRAFARYGCLLEASLAFCKIASPSLHTWHAIISVNSVLGQSKNVLWLYQLMQNEDLHPNKFIYSCIAKACSDCGDLMQGKMMHEQVMQNQVEVDAILATTLIDMYVNCGDLSSAQQVFEQTQIVNIITCNTLISGLIQQDRCICALKLFDEVLDQSIKPTSVTLLYILKACGSVASVLRGEATHDLCIRYAFELDISIGAALIDMYVKCKRIKEAFRVFEALTMKNIISWNALISGLSQQGYGHLACDFFMRMLEDGIEPDNVTYSCLFNACGSAGAIQQGNLIYDHFIKSSLQIDTIIGNTLVDMYVNFGRLEDAHNLFDQLHEKNSVTWNALINGYVKYGFNALAVLIFNKMQEAGLNPDNATLSCMIKACNTSESLKQGRVLHSYILKQGQTQDLVVNNALVHMYAESGSFDDASKVFDVIGGMKNVVSWNTLITGYLRRQQYLCVLDCFQKFLREDIKPDKVTFICLLKACENMGNLHQGMVLHSWVINEGLLVNTALGNSLLDMYLECGCLCEACKVFYSMECRDVVSWSAIISGCIQHEYGSYAIHLFYEMQNEGLELNTIPLSCVLKVCGNMQDIYHGRLIHKYIIVRNLEVDVSIENMLIYMYAKWSRLEDANRLFARSLKQDLTTWNIMISGYSQQGFEHHALELFDQLLQTDLSPNEVTFSCILNVCACIREIEQGRLIHCQVCGNGYTHDVIISNTLVDMYSKFGDFEDAKAVLDSLIFQDVVAWNALLGGLVDQGCGDVAVRLFWEMQEKNIQPNEVTFICVLKACGTIGSLEHGKLVHRKLVQGRVDVDSVLGNSLIDMYIRCGDMEEAVAVFSKLHNRDVVSYNVMISGYLQNKKGSSALRVFEKMQTEGIKADKVTALCMLKTCGSMGAIKLASLIHDQAVRDGFDSDVSIGNALINMYAACGKLEESHRMFTISPAHNVVSWTSMISAYSVHGRCTSARECLKEMGKQGLIPADAAFTSLLSACSHAGNTEEGYNYLNLMKDQYGIQPSIEHYNCILQLLGQVGCLKEAEFVLQTMPIAADLCSWMTLLIACRCFGNIHVGQWSMNKATKLDPDIIAGNPLLSTMHVGIVTYGELCSIDGR